MKIKDKSIKVKDLSLFLVVDLFFTFQVQTFSANSSARVLHFVYKLSIDMQYTHKCISNQMLKLKLNFCIAYKCGT